MQFLIPNRLMIDLWIRLTTLDSSVALTDPLLCWRIHCRIDGSISQFIDPFNPMIITLILILYHVAFKFYAGFYAGLSGYRLHLIHEIRPQDNGSINWKMDSSLCKIIDLWTIWTSRTTRNSQDWSLKLFVHSNWTCQMGEWTCHSQSGLVSHKVDSSVAKWTRHEYDIANDESN